MKISLVALFLTTPWLRPVAQYIPSSRLYRLCRTATALSMRCSTHRNRFLRPVRSVLSGYMSRERLSEVCHEYLVQRRYLNYLEATWLFMRPGQRPAAILDGADYLRGALSKGGGAVLISGHNYGFSRMVGPILAEDGYRISRTGGLSLDVVRRRWGAEVPWEYIFLPADPWERVRALKQLIAALNNNRIIHLLILNRPLGESKAEVEFYGRNFSLDFSAFELISGLKAPILPCFVLCDDQGAFTIKIHPPLGNTADELASGFAKLFSWYLKEFPEYVRFWKPLLNQKTFW
jgi:lauroyl/myristoyl acyltransferase